MTVLPPAPAGYTLRLLGAFELRDASGDLLVSAGKPLSVIAYLALTRGQRASRQSLVSLLWGDVDPERGRGSLRQAIFALRQRLRVDLIVSDGEWLALSAAVASDARDFLVEVERGAHAHAVALYTGEFIPDFASPGATDFEDWAESERRRLRGAFLAAARSHVRDLIAHGDAASAVELAGRLRDTDSDDDEHWRIRFEALALAGRFPVIDLEESMLRAQRADDGRALGTSTEAVLRRLRRVASSAPHAGGGDSPAGCIPADPEFQGRAEVFAQLLSAWGLASRGRAQRRVIVASAGFGKTRLLRELSRRLAAQRARVVYAGARQGERDDPFGFLAEIVTRVAELSGASGVAPASAAVLAGLVPVLADAFNVKPESGITDPAELLRRRALAFADLIGAVSDDRPLALLADDLQWADAASIQALDRAFTRVPRVPVLLVSASRSEQPTLGAPEERLTLPPLGRDEVALLVSSIAVAEPPGWTDALTSRIHAAAGGSPFAVLQLLRLAMERGVCRVVGDRWDVADEAALQPLLDRSAAVEWRLRALNEEDLGTLTCLALVEQPLDENTLAEAWGLGREVVREPLFRLEADAFVSRASADTWRVAHDLVAEGALEVASDTVRRRCAGRVADVLARTVTTRDLVAARLVVRLQLEAGRPDAALQFLRDWLATQPRGAYEVSEFSRVLLGGIHDPSFEAQVRALLRARRRWWRSRVMVAVVSITVTVLVVLFAILSPRTLVVTSVPDPTQHDSPSMIYEVPPRIELHNALGWVTTRRDGDTVRIMPADIDRALLGRPFAVLRNGVAVFDSVYPSWRPAPNSMLVSDVKFVLKGVDALVLRRKNALDSLAIVESTINGLRSDSRTPLVRVRPGGAIRGTVQVRYTTRGRDILYVMAQAATWGKGQRDTVTVRSLLAGVSGALFRFPLNVTAPSTRGDYWILWTHGAESTGARLLSGTNWRCPTPIWGDGNDLPTMPDSVLADGMQQGVLVIAVRLCDETGPWTPRRMPLAGVRVEVR